MKIVIKDREFGERGYEVNLDREFEGYKEGDLICFVRPFFDIPLVLEIAIRTTGLIAFRSWTWANRGNTYLHTHETKDRFTPTEKQIDTVNGLFSGRYNFEGLKLAVGATVQDICPIDRRKEEILTGRKIYLA